MRVSSLQGPKAAAWVDGLDAAGGEVLDDRGEGIRENPMCLRARTEPRMAQWKLQRWSGHIALGRPLVQHPPRAGELAGETSRLLRGGRSCASRYACALLGRRGPSLLRLGRSSKASGPDRGMGTDW